MKNYNGFTLLELLIALAVVAIVMALGVPSMQEFAKNHRLTTNINTLIGHMALARSEAVKRNQQVAVCVSDNNTTCSGANWQDGWIVYVDADASSTFSADEEVLRVQQALDGQNTLTTIGIGSQVLYDYRGFVDNASVGSIQLCDDRTGDHGKTIRITTTGRVRLETRTGC